MNTLYKIRRFVKIDAILIYHHFVILEKNLDGDLQQVGGFLWVLG
jgi:hypothetical protein